MRKELCLLLVCAMTCMALVCLKVEKTSALDVGDPAPDFTLTDAVSGETISLSDYAGKVVLLDFFGTWCIPCIDAIDEELVPLWNDYYAADPNVVFLSLDIGGATAGELQTFASDHGMGWPVLMDATAQGVKDDYGVETVPTMFLIDGAANMEIKNQHLEPPGYAALKNEIDIIPEFPSLLILLPLSMIATLLTAIVYRRNLSRLCKYLFSSVWLQIGFLW